MHGDNSGCSQPIALRNGKDSPAPYITGNAGSRIDKDDSAISEAEVQMPSSRPAPSKIAVKRFIVRTYKKDKLTQLRTAAAARAAPRSRRGPAASAEAGSTQHVVLILLEHLTPCFSSILSSSHFLYITMKRNDL